MHFIIVVNKHQLNHLNLSNLNYEKGWTTTGGHWIRSAHSVLSTTPGLPRWRLSQGDGDGREEAEMKFFRMMNVLQGGWFLWDYNDFNDFDDFDDCDDCNDGCFTGTRGGSVGGW